MADDEPPGDAVHTKGLWNRRRDLRCVRRHLGIGPDGDPDVEVRCARGDRVIAIGYRRVLLGDHGPYLELEREDVRWENLRLMPGGAARFYDEYRAIVDGESYDDIAHSSLGTGGGGRGAKLYDQIKTVEGQGNPPRDSAWAVANNRPHEEGYAAYVVGKIYVGAYDVAVRDPIVDDDDVRRAMPEPGGSGRVAWWKPARGVGAIVPDGVTGARNEGRGGGEEEFAAKEVLVTRDAIAGGADVLAPGEGVWFDLESSGSPSDRRSIASNVTGPGGEPVRQLCPGAAAAAAEAARNGQRRSETARALRDGRRSAASDAAARARTVPWEARAEVERDAVAGAARRIARILRDNCAAIAGLARIEGEGQRTLRACLRGWAKQTRARKPSETVRNGQRPSTAPRPIEPTTTTTTTRLDLTSAGRAKGLFAPVTRPPTPTNSPKTFSRGTNDDDDDDARGNPTAVALPAWLTAVARGAVVCEVSHTRASSAEDAARDAAGRVRDRCGFEAPAGLEDSVRPCVVELTRDGVGALRTADECGVLRGDRDLDPVAEAVARVDENLPVAEFGASPLVLVLPTGEEKAKAGGGGARPPRVPRLALRASKRVVGVVCVSSGPEQLVRDAVALAGACARGTAPFVPTEVFAAAGLDATREWSRDNPPALNVAVFERAGWGAAIAMETSTGRDYCWRCGDRSHRKRDCERAAGVRPGENRPATTGGGGGRDVEAARVAGLSL